MTGCRYDRQRKIKTRHNARLRQREHEDKQDTVDNKHETKQTRDKVSLTKTKTEVEDRSESKTKKVI